MVATVPLKVAIEKLRGFVADHSAEIKSIEDSRILMHVHGERKRSGDRAVSLTLELSFAEEHVRGNGGTNGATNAAGTITRTKIKVVMRPKRNRDRRRTNSVGHARLLLTSLRSYLMASDDNSRISCSSARQLSNAARCCSTSAAALASNSRS